MINETLEQLINRMSGARCEICMFAEFEKKYCECHFNPPSVIVIEDRIETLYPIVKEQSSCSNFVKYTETIEEGDDII